MTSDDPRPLSAGNARVKEARRLSRRSERTERRLFLVEGPNAVEAAARSGADLRELFVTEAARERHAALIALAAGSGEGVPVRVVDDRAMASLSDAVSPPGIIAVASTLDVAWRSVLAGAPSLLALCWQIRDPGNLGTVIRCADAAGADGVLLLGDSVDPHNPKTVRASAGSVFHLPVALADDVDEVLAACRADGVRLLAADGAGTVDLYDPSAAPVLAAPHAWVFGNEARGLDDAVLGQVDRVLRIPIHGRAESLNLSTAAALCLYAGAQAQRGRSL